MFAMNRKKLLYIVILLFLVSIPLINFFNHENSYIDEEKPELHTSRLVRRERQWIQNPDFSDPITSWNSEQSGDNSDTNADYSTGEGYFEVVGEERTFSGVSGIPTSSDWTQVHNPEFPQYPDTAEIRTTGCFASHEFAELADQTPSVHWERNVNMPVDMSDYIITSASLSAVINATVQAIGSGSGGGIEAPGDPTDLGGTQNYTWDYVRFYVLLSDLTNEKIYEVAYNQTVELGQDSPAITTMPDTIMTVVPEEDLIFYLTSVLSSDNHNFTITLGMRIWCEDNWFSDRDRWNSLLIKSCDFSFTYQKKIDRFSTVSWNYLGDELTGQNISIIDGNLRFKYKIDQTWPSVLSPNSRLSILINDNPLLETTSLSTATVNFTEVKEGGFNVTNLILKDINITLSIQLFLGDTFPLDQNYTISITDVYLNIVYFEFVPESEQEPWVFTGLFILAAIAAAILTGLLIGYIKIWRFPIPIRKLRKYKKTLADEKGPDVDVIPADLAFKKLYHQEVEKSSKFLKGTPVNGKILKKKITETKPISKNPN